MTGTAKEKNEIADRYDTEAGAGVRAYDEVLNSIMNGIYNSVD